MAGEQHGNGMGAAWARHGMCELSFKRRKTRTSRRRDKYRQLKTKHIIFSILSILQRKTMYKRRYNTRIKKIKITKVWDNAFKVI
jgi:hypothetical protein